jgi:hypothetical protein
MSTRFLPDTDLLLGNFRSAGVERVTVSFQADESETFKITRTAAIDAAGARVALKGPARKIARIVRSLTEDMLDVARFQPPWPLREMSSKVLSEDALDQTRWKRRPAKRSRRRSGPRWDPVYGDRGTLSIDVTGGRPSFRLALNTRATVKERETFAFCLAKAESAAPTCRITQEPT